MAIAGTGEQQHAVPQETRESMQCWWLEGTIVGRRVLGKHLAFATVQLAPSSASTPGVLLATNLQHPQSVQSEEKATLVKVKFRRNDPGTGSAAKGAGATSVPTRSAQLPIVWEGGDCIMGEPASLLEHGGEHEFAEPAPFPQRRSQLQLGMKVAIKACSQVADNQAPLGVISWRVLAQVGEELPLQLAPQTVDATAGSPSSGASAVEKSLSNVGSSASSVGAGAGALASAGGSFSVADRLRVRQLAHSDALAARAGGQVSGNGDSVQAPLCKYWMANGLCDAHQSGGCRAYRHEFATDGEKERAERARTIRATALEASKQVQRIYNAPTDTEAVIPRVHGTATEVEDSWLVLPDSLNLSRPERGCEPEQQLSAGHGAETKQQKGRRAAVFVAWLLKTYGVEALNEGTGVLDIAGGKGAISYELQCRNSVRCTLVDPGVRTRLLTPRQARALRKSGGTPFVHIAACFDKTFCTDEGPGENSLGVEEPENAGPTGTAELLRRASLVIGMHPDEATEAIVTHSLAHGKRFAVVPCCVFAHLFPDRVLPSANGESSRPVRDINDFCAYLKSMDPRIEEAALPFEGRNKVLFIR